MTSITHDAAAIRAPSGLLALTELPRALMELASLPLAGPLLLGQKSGDGHPVLVLPGFATGDGSTAVLRGYLRRLGYDVHGWELGRNLGPKAIGREGERLVARLRAIHDRTGRKVTLIGWSLGGVMARQLSRRLPDAVRQVVSLGSPFTGNPHATNVGRLYQAWTGQKFADPHTQAQLAESRDLPPVPSTAIYSRADGVVAWQNCIEGECATTENIEVRGSHMGLGVNPAVLYVVADRLAQPEGSWTPFDRHSGFRGIVYPAGDRVH